MGGAIISESGGGIIPLQGGGIIPELGAASSEISSGTGEFVFNTLGIRALSP